MDMGRLRESHTTYPTTYICATCGSAPSSDPTIIFKAAFPTTFHIMFNKHDLPSSVALPSVLSPPVHRQKQRPTNPRASVQRKQFSSIPSSPLHIARTGSRLGPRFPKRQQRSVFEHRKVFINPSLVILILVSVPVGNTSALSSLLVDAATFARSNVLRHGASTVLPGRIYHSESNLKYDLQPPLPRTSSRFTWGQYEAVTDWLYYYLVVLGFEALCEFAVRVVDDGREISIGFGEVDELF